MGTLFKTIFSFPFSFLESKLYNDDLNKIKGKITQEQAFISSIENITSAVFGILGLYILLFRQVSFFILLLLSVFLLFVILLSSIVNGKLSTLMYDYWQNYIKNTRKYNYISDVLSGKDYIEEKKCFLISHFF
jgi:ABC-type multidrug transport system fused ATPase/permease subunit